MSSETIEKCYLREPNYPIVCICGSTRFRNKTEEIAEKLSYNDNMVLMVNCWSRAKELRNQEGDNGVKDKLNDLHKAKIRLSDYLFVVNVNGYVGKSTKSEIEYAKLIGRPIHYLERKTISEIIKESKI